MLSQQARTWLNFFISHPAVRINHRTLMDQGVSRRKSYAILKELRDANCVKMIKYVGGGTTLKVVASDSTTVVESGIAIAAVTAVQLVSSISNSYTASTTVTATNKLSDGVGQEEKTLGYDFFERTSAGDDDDMLAARKKHQAQKNAEYAAVRERKAQARKDLHRSNLQPVDWTCKDIAYEFGDRVRDMWHIKPFSITQTQFLSALATFRKQHETDGAVELELMNLFFGSIKAEKYTDGNHLWRAFLYKAPQLLQTARERVIGVARVAEDIVRDTELADRKLSIFDEDDDV